jgi:hypothetical protein
MFALHPTQPFAERFGDRLGHTLSGKPGELLGELVGIFVFDVEAYNGRNILSSLPFYHRRNRSHLEFLGG